MAYLPSQSQDLIESGPRPSRKFIFGFICFSIFMLKVFVNMSHAFERLPKVVPTPKDNPTTAEKVKLGRQLYFDARLSKDNTVSCQSCHNANTNGVDGTPVSVGIGGQKGGRNAPTVLNAAFASVQFWDGRAASLEDQAKGPLTNPIEMGMENHDAVVAKLKTIPEYVSAFEKAFPAKARKKPTSAEAITIDNVAKAIAAYERTLITRDAPYDKYLAGDKKALNAAAVRGLQLVQTVGCVGCHSGAMFNGPAMPQGVGFYQKFPVIPNADYEKQYGFSKDLGRFEVTKQESDKNMWRVPTWRNVAITAPYFHNGSVAKLADAVRIMAKTQLNKELKDEEVNDIVAFLESLTGVNPEAARKLSSQ